MREKKEVNVFVGARIQTARERSGFTQDKLSELLGVSTNHLSAIERGVYGMPLENLRKVCRLLNVSADYLLFGDTPGSEEIAIAKRLTAIEPQYKNRVMAGIDAILDICDMKK